MATKFGVLWGVLSFVIVPVGGFVAPFLVGTWPILAIAVVLYGVGSVRHKRTETNKKAAAEAWLVNDLQQRAQETRVAGPARLTRALPDYALPFEGDGVLYGLADGRLFWDTGTASFDAGRSTRTWELRKSNGSGSEGILVLTQSIGGVGAFVIASNITAWLSWCQEHFGDHQVRDGSENTGSRS